MFHSSERKNQITYGNNHCAVPKQPEIFFSDTDHYSCHQNQQYRQKPKYKYPQKTQVIYGNIQQYPESAGDCHNTGTAGKHHQKQIQKPVSLKHRQTHKHQYQIKKAYQQQLEKSLMCVFCIGIAFRQQFSASKQKHHLYDAKNQIYRCDHGQKRNGCHRIFLFLFLFPFRHIIQSQSR